LESTGKGEEKMSEYAIVTRDLRKSYKRNVEVVKGLNMSVKKGAVYALLGSNGVGKTTTIRMITGQLAPSSGDIEVFGLEPLAHRKELNTKVAYVAEDQRLYDWMTVNELIKFVKSFYPNWDDKICEHLLKMFELPCDKKLTDFSRGMYTKAALLAALCRNPDLLILDDPTLGLDTAARREFMRGVVDAIHEFDRTVIFSTHIIPEIEGIVDHVGIMVDGQLVADEEIDDMKEAFREIRLPITEQIPDLAGIVDSREAGGDKIITLRAKETEINAVLKESRIKNFSINPISLEEIYLALTKK
jgi:ABC-2 type transport system ATP-binding protein